MRYVHLYRIVAWNARGGGETVVAFENGLATFNAGDGVAVFLADGDVARDDVL